MIKWFIYFFYDNLYAIYSYSNNYTINKEFNTKVELIKKKANET